MFRLTFPWLLMENHTATVRAERLQFRSQALQPADRNLLAQA